MKNKNVFILGLGAFLITTYQAFASDKNFCDLTTSNTETSNSPHFNTTSPLSIEEEVNLLISRSYKFLNALPPSCFPDPTLVSESSPDNFLNLKKYLIELLKNNKYANPSNTADIINDIIKLSNVLDSSRVIREIVEKEDFELIKHLCRQVALSPLPSDMIDSYQYSYTEEKLPDAFNAKMHSYLLFCQFINDVVWPLEPSPQIQLRLDEKCSQVTQIVATKGSSESLIESVILARDSAITERDDLKVDYFNALLKHMLQYNNSSGTIKNCLIDLQKTADVPKPIHYNFKTDSKNIKKIDRISKNVIK